MTELEPKDVVKNARKRLISNKEMFFFWLSAVGGSKEGVLGVRKLGRRFGVGKSAASRYFAHSSLQIYSAINSDPNRLQ